MADNGKRPNPTIEGTAKPLPNPGQRLELPPPKAVKLERKRGGGFFSHFAAAVFGGAAVAAFVYAVSLGEVPGVSLTDANTIRELRYVQNRTAELDRAVRGQGSSTAFPAQSQSGNEVAARLDAVVQTVRAMEETVQALPARLAALERRPAGAAAQAAIPVEFARETEAASARIQALETSLESLTRLRQSERASDVARVQALEKDIETLTKAQSERVADARSAALTLALTNLKRALGDGRGFSAELAAVENLSPAKLPISQLAAFKGGVATMAELVRDFDDPSKKAIEAHYRGESGSLVGEVFSRARAAIQVRPTGGNGTTPEAIVGRMAASLRGGNLAEALAAAAGLEPRARDELRAWMERAQARLTADETVRKTDQELLAALTKPPVRRQ